MGSNRELLLVHRNMDKVSLDHRVNVMLTPQFYTMKKEELPIKYLYQAKKIAPSLFDGLLDEQGNYEYFVFKEKDKWVFIAYNPEEIKEFLKSKGILEEYLSKIFFAQQVQHAFVQPIVLSDKEVLMTIDDVVVLVPKTVLSRELKTAIFDESFTPKSGVTLAGNGNALISKKEMVILSALFIVFASVFFIEGWQYSRSMKVQEKEMQELLEAYPALQSKMKRESVAFKYRTINNTERKKRDTIKTLAAMIFKGVTLTAYHMDEKHFKVTFACDNAKIAAKVEALAKKSNFKVTNNKGSNIVVIEGKV
jgi:hypothetical protein